MVDEAYIGHDGAKVLINDSGAGGPNDEFYDAIVTTRSEQTEHHVREEEMADIGIFAQARASGIDLIALGNQLKVRKQELMIEGTSNGLPPAKPAVVNLVAA